MDVINANPRTRTAPPSPGLEGQKQEVPQAGGLLPSKITELAGGDPTK